MTLAMRQAPEIAILTPNVLTGIGLKTILEKIIPGAEAVICTDFDTFEQTGEERFFHYFVASQIFLPHAAFFRERRHKTILLTDGRPRDVHAGMHTLDVCAGEERLVRDILLMHRSGHPDRSTAPRSAAPRPVLTDREVEVLQLLVRGRINKQIAEELGIGITTVITHRRNIMEKMGVRSVAELILSAVEAGYVDADRI